MFPLPGSLAKAPEGFKFTKEEGEIYARHQQAASRAKEGAVADEFEALPGRPHERVGGGGKRRQEIPSDARQI